MSDTQLEQGALGPVQRCPRCGSPMSLEPVAGSFAWRCLFWEDGNHYREWASTMTVDEFARATIIGGSEQP